MLDTCHVRVCRAQWPAVRDHPEGGGEQARHPPLVGVHLVLLLPHLRPGNGSLLVSVFHTFFFVSVVKFDRKTNIYKYIHFLFQKQS